MAEDDIVQLIEDPGRKPAEQGPRWKVAVIDDEPAVHDGTRFALSDYRLNGQGLEILSAYSAAEGRELMRRHPDVAVVLLDVIMDTDTAGLGLVEFIRKDLKNETVRIILRTGQPGQAPERRVIVDYDINDYKAKTELTADKLFTSLTAALRSYQQLQRMVETRRGLEIIIEAASTLFDFKSMQRLAEGVLTQIGSLLNVECAGILVLREAQNARETFSVLAGSGCYSRFIGSDVSQILDHDLRRLVAEAFARRHHEFSPHRSVLYIGTMSGREVVVVLEAPRQLSGTDRTLVEIFCSRLSIAFDNVKVQIAYIRDAANRLTGMVDDLVADAMADALDISIRREPVDISILVQEVAEANRPLAARKEQTITVAAPPNHAAMCDADRIREAIDNLVSNAVKYSPIGGAIKLLAGQENGGILVRVSDQGAGLSPEDISRLFGRFQRLSAKPTAGETSTGLGLSIVKRIVDLHGGRIAVDSAGPGKGATFKMILPVT